MSATLIRIDDAEFAGAESEQGVSDRGPRSAGTELDNPVAAHIGEFSLEALRKSPPVRVVTDTSAVFQDNGIDRTKCLRIRGQLIEKLDHGLFAGVGDIEPSKAETLGCSENIRKSACIDAERLQIDQLVDIAQPCLAPSRS
jgi:hypothetical protein